MGFFAEQEDANVIGNYPNDAGFQILRELYIFSDPEAMTHSSRRRVRAAYGAGAQISILVPQPY